MRSLAATGTRRCGISNGHLACRKYAPTSIGAHQQLGPPYQQGDPRGALDEFQEAVRWLPESAKAHYSIGVLMESVGRHPQAIEHFETAVRSDPSYVEAHLQLARVLQQSGRLAEAQRQYAEAAAIDPRVVVTK
jgi:Tfp pilus assembly protein PilF